MPFITPKEAFPPGYRDDTTSIRSAYPSIVRTNMAAGRPAVELDESGVVVTRFAEDEVINIELRLKNIRAQKQRLEEELQRLLSTDVASINRTQLHSERRLKQVDREFRRFELQKKIDLLRKDEQQAKIQVSAAQRASFCSKLRMSRVTDHRGRFLYPNGWLSITNRRVACKESDPNWGLGRPAQYTMRQTTQHACLSVYLVILLVCTIMVLSARLIPTTY